MSLWPLESRGEGAGEAGRGRAPVAMHSTLLNPVIHPQFVHFETGLSQMLTGLVLGVGPSRTPTAPPGELIAS